MQTVSFNPFYLSLPTTPLCATHFVSSKPALSLHFMNYYPLFHVLLSSLPAPVFFLIFSHPNKNFIQLRKKTQYSVSYSCPGYITKPFFQKTSVTMDTVDCAEQERNPR